MITFERITQGRIMWDRYVLAYAKALAGALLAALGAFIVASADDSVTLLEWAAVASTGLATLIGVRQVPWMPNQRQPEIPPPHVARKFPPDPYTD